ncbi:rRNA-processing protein utp21 [Sorochytrium milnesiophthora]
MGLRGRRNKQAKRSHKKSTDDSDIPLGQSHHARTGLFQPFRALGYVANEIPFTIQKRGTENFITTCTGNAFQIYNCEKLNLLFVGPQTASPITALASHGDLTFAAVGAEINVYRRAQHVTARRYMADGQQLTAGSFSNGRTGSVFQMLVFGEYLLALTEDNVLSVFLHGTRELQTEIEFGKKFRASVFVHPSTYINKVLVASAQGSMQLWNIQTNKLIYEFASFKSHVTALVQSPVIDVVGVGLLDGTVVVHNLKMDETIMRLKQESRVTSIAFRSDDQHVMATAGMDGDIAIWDLEKRRLLHNMKNVHEGTIPSIEFLVGQPILVTSGADNAVYEYIFDSPDGSPRILRSRSGHHAPPTCVRFYDAEGKFMLSSARDRALRMFSVIRDSQSTELSQGPGINKQSKSMGVSVDQLKLPVVTAMYACELKERDWDNIITAHAGDAGARTWNYKRKAIGEHVLYSKDKTALKAVTISHCGNFALVGAASGRIDMFNIQSGAHRREFVGHTKAVSGVVVDRINKYVISSSLDKTIKLWDFKTGKEVYTFAFSAPITQLLYHHDNELIAAVGDDLCVRVVDFDTRRTVREFWGHRNRIIDIAFSPDGRWIVSASLDATIRTWDLPSGHCVDLLRTDSVATSVSFSPVGDFLATTHVDNLGVFLWANRSQFSNVSLRAVTEAEEEADTTEVALPTAAGLGDDADDDTATVDPTAGANLAYTDYQTPEQLTDAMITLSSLPKSRWQNLLNLEAIKTRNKPIEPPKQPEKAPFFLPTTPGILPTFVAPEKKDDDAMAVDRGLMFTSMSSTFAQNLRACDASGDYTPFITYAKGLSPSAMDIELRTLTPNHFESFLQSCLYQIQTRKSFELVQAWLNVFLKIHSDMLSRDESCRAVLQQLIDTHGQEWSRVEGSLRYCNCLLDFIRGA